MIYEGQKREWVPTANTLIPPGFTDNYKQKSPLLKLSHFTEPIQVKTTSQQASKPVTNYWVRRHENPGKPAPVQSQILQPDVRQTMAYMLNRDLAQRDSVKFGQVADDDEETSPTTDIEHLHDEYDNRRTRGIPGYTGTQPSPHQRRPLKVEDAVDPSRFYGKGGSSERKHWTKGIPGYTGHQPNLDNTSLNSEGSRYGVFVTVDTLGDSSAEDVGARTMLEMAPDGLKRSVSSHMSGVSSSSQRKIKPAAVRNTPADIARRKIEEALSWGDKEVDHEGSTATLALAKRFHIAPQRSCAQCPREPVEGPKPGPYHEGPGAWKSTKTWRPDNDPKCDFDWFMERPLPTDKRPEADHEPEFWKEMSGLIVHEGKHAGRPVIPYNSVKHMRGVGAYGAVQNAVPTAVSKERMIVP